MGQEEQAGATGFAALSGVMYRTARRLAEQSKQETGSDVHGVVTAVVVLTQACLEAYLNEFLEIQQHAVPASWASVVEDLAAVGLAGRYSIVARFVNGKTFDAGAEPFQSLKLLIALRNELTHYSPRFRPLGELPKKMLAGLKTKFGFQYEGRGDWTIQVLNPNCAIWACDTAKSETRK